MSSDKNKRRILTSKQSETRKLEEKPPDELIKKIYKSLQLIQKFIQQHKMNLLIGKQMLAGSVGREMRGRLSHARA